MSKPKIYSIAIGVIFAWSVWLMWSSFRITSDQLSIGGKFWSDFGSHIAVIRSFSKGQNWPPEYPLYPNQPIQYHFLFYAFVGLLEKTGLPLDVSLNIPSALGLTLMIVMVVMLAKKITNNTFAAILSGVFIVLNGSLSWLEFIQKHTLSELGSLQNFVSFGPWNGSEIGAFWSLNIFTNQRHLPISFALALMCIYVVYSAKQRLLYGVGFLLGLLLWLNIAAFGVAVAFVVWFSLLHSQVRKPVLISLFGIVPWIVGFWYYIIPPSSLRWEPGFLLPPPQNAYHFVVYWIKNLGLHTILIPLGLIWSPKKAKQFIIPLLGLFIIPNLIQFSPDMFNNHKFFNFFILLGGIFSAYAIARLRWIGLVLIPLMIAGGVVDFMPLKNDTHFSIVDYPKNPDVAYFIEHTSPNAVVLNSTWFYHPASLAGRKIFNGYPYFTWSYGYDQVSREQLTQQIYSSSTTEQACAVLNKFQISYVELNPLYEKIIAPNMIVWDSWHPEYENNISHLKVYKVDKNCL